MVWRRAGRRAPFRLGSRARDEGCGAGAGVKSFSANDLPGRCRSEGQKLSQGCHSVWGGPTMATAEDAIDWLELHVNYAGEDLTWNDLMFIRMERAIERQIAELRERNIGGMEEL